MVQLRFVITSILIWISYPGLSYRHKSISTHKYFVIRVSQPFCNRLSLAIYILILYKRWKYVVMDDL